MKSLLSYRLLIPLSVLLGLSPFFPQPHIVQKVAMLMDGTLRQPLDIFDLCWHGWPIILLGFRIGRDMGHGLRSRQSPSE